MLNKIIQFKNHLFWSKNNENQIVIGGSVNGLCYGKISFALEEEKVSLFIVTPSDLTESDFNDNPIIFFKNQIEYDLILNLFKEYELKISESNFLNDLNRDILIKNTTKLFK